MLIFCYFSSLLFNYFTSHPILLSTISGFRFSSFFRRVCRGAVLPPLPVLSRILFFFFVCFVLINLFKYKFVDLVVRFLL